jgi:hypothetical protein
MAFAAKFNPKCLVGSCLLELGEIMRREGQRFILASPFQFSVNMMRVGMAGNDVRLLLA